MYLVVIAWLYVVLMAALVEATSNVGTVLGAVVTFVLYGLLPLSIVMYILGTPGRKRALYAQAMAERAVNSAAPDADSKDLPFAIQAARQHIELMERAELSFLLGLEKETPRWEHSLSTPVPKHFNKVNQPRGAQ